VQKDKSLNDYQSGLPDGIFAGEQILFGSSLGGP
jgi:hypothetical protein